MKKGIIVLLAVLMVLSFASCKSNKTEVVKVVSDPVWPPFEMMDEKTKEMTGYDIDVIKAIAEKEGFQVEMVNLTFDALVPALAQCQYDAGISAITITEERQKQMLFSDPYFDAGQILTVKVGDEDLNSKEAMAGKTIGVQIGTTGAFMAQEWEDEGLCTMKGYDTVDLAFLDLKNGQIDATLTDNTVADAYSASLGGIVPVGDLFSTEQYGIAICKTKTDLQTKINDGLKALKADGTMDKLYDKYFSKPTEE